MQPIRTRVILFACATACALPLLVSPVPANGSAVHAVANEERVAAYLRAHPGGVVINSTEISYADGAFIVTVAPSGNSLAGPDCPYRWFCFYERVNFGFPRGKLSDCTRQNLANWDWDFRVQSAYYNLDVGNVAFYYFTAELFRIGVTNRARADAYPFRNMANYVQRFCSRI